MKIRRIVALVVLFLGIGLFGGLAARQEELAAAIIPLLIGGVLGTGVALLTRRVKNWTHPAVLVPLMVVHAWTLPISYEAEVATTLRLGLGGFDTMFLAVVLAFGSFGTMFDAPRDSANGGDRG